MLSFLSSFELVQLVGTLLVGGVIAGFLAGMFGIGGGAILVPVFYQLFALLGVDEAVCMHLSVGTSFGVIVPTSIRSYYSHLKFGKVDQDMLRSWMIAVPVGVALASAITAYISGASLRVIFAIIAVVVGSKLIFAKDSWRLGDDLPKKPISTLVGGGIGFVSTFMGIGGGVMNNTYMTLFGRPLHQAVSTSAGVGVLIAVPGVIGYVIAGLWSGSSAYQMPMLTFGYVNLVTVLVIIPVTLLMAPLGVRVAHMMSKRHLELVFGGFLFLVAARFIFSLLG